MPFSTAEQKGWIGLVKSKSGRRQSYFTTSVACVWIRMCAVKVCFLSALSHNGMTLSLLCWDPKVLFPGKVTKFPPSKRRCLFLLFPSCHPIQNPTLVQVHTSCMLKMLGVEGRGWWWWWGKEVTTVGLELFRVSTWPTFLFLGLPLRSEGCPVPNPTPSRFVSRNITIPTEPYTTTLSRIPHPATMPLFSRRERTAADIPLVPHLKVPCSKHKTES